MPLVQSEELNNWGHAHKCSHLWQISRHRTCPRTAISCREIHMSKVFVVIITLVCFESAALAQENYSFGTGEKYTEASQPWNPCGSTPAVVAQDTCSVHMPNQTKVRFGYTVDLVSTVSGGECGYSKYDVGCYGMPQIAENRIKIFVVGQNRPTGCGTDLTAVSRDFCTIKGQTPSEYPFTIRRTNTSGGGHCGYNTYEVKCRAPFPPRTVPKFEHQKP
jgi:hypothetical protein